MGASATTDHDCPHCGHHAKSHVKSPPLESFRGHTCTHTHRHTRACIRTPTQRDAHTDTYTQLSDNKGTPGMEPGEGPDDLLMTPGDPFPEDSSLLIQEDK